MKRIYSIAFILWALTLSSCCHNNGDIGPWFGQWKITQILNDGTPDGTYTGNIFISFQAGVVQINKVENDVNQYPCWGSWDEEGDIMTLNFGHHDDGGADTDWRYRLPAELHLEQGPNRLTIETSGSSSARLSYHGQDGHLYTYVLKKWG